jgi:hypothetical protein
MSAMPLKRKQLRSTSNSATNHCLPHRELPVAEWSEAKSGVRVRFASGYGIDFARRANHRLSCPAPFAKIFLFRPDPNQIYIPRCLVPHRGVSRSSRTRGGMRWTRQRRAMPGDGRAGRKARELTNGTRTNGANADGKAVWSWHPLLVLNPRRRVGPTGLRQTLNPRMTVTRRIRRRGEHEISR